MPNKIDNIAYTRGKLQDDKNFLNSFPQKIYYNNNKVFDYSYRISFAV